MTEELLPCGCERLVSVIISVEAFVPAAHWNSRHQHPEPLIEAAVDELADTQEWYSIELKVPQPDDPVLNPPHNTDTCNFKREMGI